MSDLSFEMARARREEIRWFLLRCLQQSTPDKMYTEPMLGVVRTVYPNATHLEIRRELGYLEARELVKITRDAFDRWCADLTRAGVDVVEYTVLCEPGIARPALFRD